MKHLAFWAAVTFAVSGCLEPKTCAEDSECAEGTCHPTYKFCVYEPSDAGAMGGGGGTTGGGGGAVTGGGGGATGGGGGATGGGGGATTGGGGGATGGGGGATGGGGGATGGGGGATGGGGGTDAGMPNCSVAVCTDPYVCQPTLQGGQCIPAYVLTWFTPTAGETLTSASTAFTVRARLLDGGVPTSLSGIPLSIPGWPVPSTTLQPSSADTFVATTAVPATQSSFTASAGWDGGVVTRAFSVDRVPPQLALFVAPSLDGGSHPRDGLVPVLIRPSEPINPNSLSLRLVGTDGGTQLQTTVLSPSVCGQRGLSVASGDLCSELDLASVPFAAMSGTIGLRWSVADVAGNTSADAGPDLNVTRLRWRTQPLVAPAQVVAAPALDSFGNLFIGTQDSATTGRVLSYSPSGSLRFARPNVGAVQSLAVSPSDIGSSAQEVVFVASNISANQSQLNGFLTDGGTSDLSSTSGCLSLRLTGSAIALYAGASTAGRTEARALMIQNPGTAISIGAACSWGPRHGERNLDGDFEQPAPYTGNVLSPPNLVVSGTKAFFLHADSTLTFVDVTLPQPDIGGSSGGFGGRSVSGTALAFGAGGNSLFATWANATVPLAVYYGTGFGSPVAAAGGWGTVARGPVVGAGDTVVLATNRVNEPQWLMSFQHVGGSPPIAVAGPVAAPAGVDSAVTPVLGTSSKLYTIRRDGWLTAYDTGATGVSGRTPDWAGNPFGTNLDVLAHPTLDCNRQAAGRNGTLYVVGLDGRIAAVIVDSTKLEPTAPWPRWQRGAANTGNFASALNPGCP